MSKTILYFQNVNCEAGRKKLAGFTRFAASQKWRITRLCTPNDRRLLRRLLEFWKPDGIVIDLKRDGPVLGDIPTVILATPPPGYKGKALFVTHDSAATTELAAKELLSLDHPNYAFAEAVTEESWSRVRRETFEKILKLHGRSCLAFSPSRQDRRSILSLQRHLFKWLRQLPKPCALYAANDNIGQAVLDAANAIGIKVPGELAVCSVDNDEQICLCTTPTMTSIEPDYFLGGYLAGTLFKDIFDSPHPKKVRTPIMFGPATLKRRGSTRATAYRDKTVNAAIDFIRENFCRGIGVGDVVKLFSCTRRMAEIRFKKAAGRTIQEEILSTRLEFAHSLIRRPGLSLEAVATLSGWKTYSVFRKYFLKSTGQTPKDIRKSATA